MSNANGVPPWLLGKLPILVRHVQKNLEQYRGLFGEEELALLLKARVEEESFAEIECADYLTLEFMPCRIVEFVREL